MKIKLRRAVRGSYEGWSRCWEFGGNAVCCVLYFISYIYARRQIRAGFIAGKREYLFFLYFMIARSCLCVGQAE